MRTFLLVTHGIDIESEIIKKLTDDLIESIDQEIIDVFKDMK